MNIDNLDKEYLDIVNDILYSKEFLKLKNCEHHGISRYDHSLKVSYKAYKYAKKHNLDYKRLQLVVYYMIFLTTPILV